MQKAEDILTPEGVMEVWLLEAQNVPKMDFFGSGHPYAKYAPNARKRSIYIDNVEQSMDREF